MPLPLKYYNDLLQGTDPALFATSGCLNPRKIYVYNGLIGTNEPMYVDCGHCIRCKDQKRNELASRMILHAKSEPWKYVYFVTLTYGSYNLNTFESHPFKSDWLETFPVQDTYNKNARLVWTPSILVSSHFTKFMKRLRKQHPVNLISYAVAGELGGSFGRPHFHAILYSTLPLTKKDICLAWSFDCYEKSPGNIVRYCGGFSDCKKRFTFLIGRVDFHDLVANGTCDFDSVKNPNDPSVHGARNAFAYVAKYCVKDTKCMPKIAEQRYKKVYNQLQDDIEYLSLLGKSTIYNYNPIHSIETYNSFGEKYSYFVDRIVEYDAFLSDDEYELVKNLIDLKDKDYNLLCRINEYPSFIRDYIFNEQYKLKQFKKNGKEFKKQSFNDFKRLFGTYFSSSRKYSLGRGYFLQNAARFAEGNFALRKVQGKPLTFPTYFFRLLENREFGIRFRSRVESGESLCKGSLRIVYGFFSKFRENAYLPFDTATNYLGTRFAVPTENFCRKLKNDFCVGDINPYVPERGSLLDITLFTGDNERKRFVFNRYNDSFVRIEYDRSRKKFYSCESISRIDMCDLILDRIDKLAKRYPITSDHAQKKLTLYDAVVSSSFREMKIEEFLSQREKLDIKYNSEHLTKDYL